MRQTIRGSGCRGAVAGGRHRVDGAEDGGEEVRLFEALIRRRQWTAQVPASFRPPPALADDGVGGGGRRGCGGGASRRPRANPRSVRTVGEGCGGGELGITCPGPSPYSL